MSNYRFQIARFILINSNEDDLYLSISLIYIYTYQFPWGRAILVDFHLQDLYLSISICKIFSYRFQLTWSMLINFNFQDICLLISICRKKKNWKCMLEPFEEGIDIIFHVIHCWSLRNRDYKYLRFASIPIYLGWFSVFWIIIGDN